MGAVLLRVSRDKPARARKPEPGLRSIERGKRTKGPRSHRDFACPRPKSDDTGLCHLVITEEIMAESYMGACFCGAVEVQVTGQPNAMGYCHCRSCRSWSGGPVNAFTLWSPEAVKVTRGAENITTYQKTELSQRQSCRLCGGHLMTTHPPLKMIDVFAATIPDLSFVPQVHVNYAETVLPMRDGLPKLKDFPAEFGGSGEAVPE
jgi:hypothetical protein